MSMHQGYSFTSSLTQKVNWTEKCQQEQLLHLQRVYILAQWFSKFWSPKVNLQNLQDAEPKKKS